MTAASDFALGLVGLLGTEAAVGEAFHITSAAILTGGDLPHDRAGGGRGADDVHVPSQLIASLYPDRGGSLLGDKAWSVVFDNTKIRRLVPVVPPAGDLRRGDGALDRMARRQPRAPRRERGHQPPDRSRDRRPGAGGGRLTSN